MYIYALFTALYLYHGYIKRCLLWLGILHLATRERYKNFDQSGGTPSVRGASQTPYVIGWIDHVTCSNMAAPSLSCEVEDFVKKKWEIEKLLEYRRVAMACVYAKKDSLICVPTGSCKSLCFEAIAEAFLVSTTAVWLAVSCIMRMTYSSVCRPATWCLSAAIAARGSSV